METINYNISNFGPGSNELIGGDYHLGFFGEVPVDELISGSSLSMMIGLRAGTEQFSDEPWLKFVRKGKILFVAKKCFRYDLNWESIKEVNAVDGSRRLSIGGNSYRIRLLEGSSSNPSKWDETIENSHHDPDSAINSEWNDLMYPVHLSKPDSQEMDNYRDFLKSDYILSLRPYLSFDNYIRYFNDEKLTSQDLNALSRLLPENIFKELEEKFNSIWRPYNDYELNVADWFGRNTWCQELWFYSDLDELYAVQRGCEDVAYATVRRIVDENSSYGWRPVLELI